MKFVPFSEASQNIKMIMIALKLQAPTKLIIVPLDLALQRFCAIITALSSKLWLLYLNCWIDIGFYEREIPPYLENRE